MIDIKEYKESLHTELDQLFDATETALEEWDAKGEEGNLQFPALLMGMAVKFNWNEKTMRENDPIVRKYIRAHTKWHVTRGAHGGIMRRADWDKKNAGKVAKELAKKQMAEAIEAKVAAAQAKTETDSE